MRLMFMSVMLALQERIEDGGVEEIEMQLESDDEREEKDSSSEEEGLSKMEDRTHHRQDSRPDNTQVTTYIIIKEGQHSP